LIRSIRSQESVDSNRLTLYWLVLIAGAATMGVEMCASRLLAPYFGNSLPVWGLLIGLLLACLAGGYFVGGRLADRHPQARWLYELTAWAGLLIGCVPYLSRPILRYAVVALAGYQAGAVLGSLLGVLALFAVPVLLLGCVSPFALRLSIQDAASSGHVAGRLYALSTMGSLLGTFGTVFWLIPSVGTRRTLFLLSLALLLSAILGLWQTARRRLLLYALLLLAVLALQLLPLGAIKPGQGVIYERDSAYNYIQVLRDGEDVLLKLNEGEGIQSAYHPREIITGYVYDYFLLVPFFKGEPPSPPVSHLCLVGLAAGTTARQYSAVFGPIPIDGVEIDPAVVEAGQRFFDLNLPNLHIAIEDGRYFLAHSGQQYDVILVDAYNPPYIPFQLTTAEFFRQTREHLTADGVVGINVARTAADYTLVNAIANTLRAVYPSVYVMDTQGNLNSVVVATQRPTDLATVTARLAGLTDPLLSNVAARATGRVREFETVPRQVLSDDHAPVEQIVHGMILRYLLGQPNPDPADPAGRSTSPEVNP
jgi:predicted membrane-bound spermidine synthase